MKRKNKIILTVLVIISMLTMIILCFINTKPIIKLKGKEVITLEINHTYQEPGYNVTYLTKDITEFLKVEGKVDTKKVGTYTLKYKLKYKNKEYVKQRIVKVVNSSYPVINLLGEGTIELCPNKDYKETGFTAYDKVDGDITNKVQSSIESNSVQYFVENSSGNKIMQERKIIRKDEDAPTIELKGYQSLIVYKGDTYFEAGYKAVDNCDGNITDNVTIEGNIDVNKVGEYKLTYKVQDSVGNINSTDRIINIIERPNQNQKTIYLTFDDGPSSSTEKILDILKQEGINATFFVINANEKYNRVIKRAYDEGNTIGLHSYSHKYKSIYKSETAYFDDLKLISDKVKKITGEKSKIIRFPGGSSNTISRNSRGLMTKLSIKTKEKGYTYFDWNIASNDTSNISSTKIKNKVISQLGKYQTNVVLMHDFANQKSTINALKDIIQHGKKNGYRFDKITEATPQIKHKIKN